MNEAIIHPELKYKSALLNGLFLNFCAAADNSEFQSAKNVASTFQNHCEEIASSATYDLGYPPMFEGELKKVVAWMNSTVSMKIFDQTQRVQYEYFLNKAFNHALKNTEGDKA